MFQYNFEEIKCKVQKISYNQNLLSNAHNNVSEILRRYYLSIKLYALYI